MEKIFWFCVFWFLVAKIIGFFKANVSSITSFIVTILLIICVLSILPKLTPEEIAANEEKRLAIEKAEHEKEQAESSRYAGMAPTLQSAIQAYGYRCGTVDMDSIVPFSWSGKNGFHVYCNGFQYGYEVEDVGGTTVVTVK